MKKNFERFYEKLAIGFCFFFPLGGICAESRSVDFGIQLGVSSSNTQVPERLYKQWSPLLGLEVHSKISEGFSFGGFWEVNRLKTRSSLPGAFSGSASQSGPSHFFGVLLRFRPIPSSPWFYDIKAGANKRSIGDQAPDSDFSVGLGAAVGYRFVNFGSGNFSTRLGYRILSYSVDNVGHFSHQGYDVNVLYEF
jgi:hypothetical protein